MTVEVANAPPTAEEEYRRAAVLEAARRSFLFFVKLTFPEYHVGKVHGYIGRKLEEFEERVRRKESPRLILLMPPRSGKSELVSRRFPPWVLGRNPDWSVILTSYGADLAEELSGDARGLVQSEEYQEVFGLESAVDPRDAVELEKGRKALSHWRIQGKRGGMRAVGVGGAITGRGAHVLAIDDYLKNRKAADSDTEREDQWNWYRSTARTRVEPGGGILITATHWHHDDLVGRLRKLAAEDPNADQWEEIRFPAIAEEQDALGRQEGDALDPERFDLAALLNLKASVGDREWAALYQQRPTDEEGAIFKRDWWRHEDPRYAPTGSRWLVGDLAFSRNRQADYTVFGLWQVEPGPVYRLLDVYRERLTFPESRQAAIRLMGKYRFRAAIIEKKGQTDDRFKEWASGIGFPVLWYTPDRDKVQRAHAVTPMIAGGQVILPKEAPWLTDYLTEHGQFPAGAHDDQVDMTTMGLLAFSRGIRLRGSGGVQLRSFRVVA